MDIDAYSDAWVCKFFKKLKHSILYIDNPMAELIHFHGGYCRLIEQGGAKLVLSLDESKLKPFVDSSKIVFLVNKTVSDESLQSKIREIIEANAQIDYCTVITTVTNNSNSDGTTTFEKFEQILKQWMGNMSYTAEVLFMPLFTTSLNDDFVLIPNLASLNCGLTNEFFHSDFDYLPTSLQQDIEILTGCLNHLFTTQNFHQEIFCVGPTSSVIGQRLAQLQQNNKIQCKESISIVFIDRSADLLTPLFSGRYSALDAVLNNSIHFSCHKTEMEISESEKADIPFTLFESHSDPQTKQFLQYAQENPFDETVDFGVAKLENLLQTKHPDYNDIDSLCNHYRMETLLQKCKPLSPIAQLCVALKQCKKYGNLQRHKIIERILIHVELMTKISPDITEEFVQFTMENNLDFEQCVLCLVAVYSFGAVKALRWDDGNLKGFLMNLCAKTTMPESKNPRLFIDSLFIKLKNVARLRQVIEDQNLSVPYIGNLVERILDPKNEILPEISHKTAGFGYSLKSSLNAFLSLSSKQAPSIKPSYSKTIFIFVVGGITCYEVAKVRKVAKLHNKQVIMSSTHLINVNDIFEMILSSKSAIQCKVKEEE